MQGAPCFSAFDLTSGCWQVPVAEADQYKSAFVTRDGLFEWNRMPFGLKCAPATFCRLMGKVIAGMSFVDCLVYMDDVVDRTAQLGHESSCSSFLRTAGPPPQDSSILRSGTRR
ncbi:hypothetical protein PBRA_009497 [Plasmodiophora brassicae]|uniref:Reverse transcriptase domain-containing protein n=1 Tax=Plasmodiophora brassicae TaxID=37360 RepID=A0A0G4J7Z9_PLABS|nr:hypothetical protein PBRA_009497 [Plasmodiophora brassicae]